MSFWSDMDCEMQPLPLDSDTADRLLAGRVAFEDAPPGYGRVVQLLEAAAEPSTEVLELEHVAAIAAVVRSSAIPAASSRRSLMPFTLSRPRLATAVLAAAFAATAGLASAGSLPGAAQEVASAMLEKIGITVPGTNDNAGTHPDVRGTSGSVPSTPADAGKGGEISELATTTELTGVEKGAAISAAASDGKSQAGQHGAGSSANAPVATPAGGGSGTADTASGGQSAPGTSTANTASDGNSSAGSGNAGAGQETAETASGGHSSAGSENAGEGQSHRP